MSIFDTIFSHESDEDDDDEEEFIPRKKARAPLEVQRKSLYTAFLEEVSYVALRDPQASKDLNAKKDLICNHHLAGFLEFFINSRKTLVDIHTFLEDRIRRDFQLKVIPEPGKLSTEDQKFLEKNEESLMRIVHRVAFPTFNENSQDIDSSFYMRTICMLSVAEQRKPPKYISIFNELSEQLRSLTIEEEGANAEEENEDEEDDEESGFSTEELSKVLHSMVLDGSIGPEFEEEVNNEESTTLLKRVSRQIERVSRTPPTSSPPRVPLDQQQQQSQQQQDAQQEDGEDEYYEDDECDEVNMDDWVEEQQGSSQPPVYRDVTEEPALPFVPTHKEKRRIHFKQNNPVQAMFYNRHEKYIVPPNAQDRDAGYYIYMTRDNPSRQLVDRFRGCYGRFAKCQTSSTGNKGVSKSGLMINTTELFIRSSRFDYNDGGTYFPSHGHIDIFNIRPLNDRELEQQLRHYIRQLYEFDQWNAGIISHSYNPVYGVLFMTDSLLECLQASTLINAAVQSYVYPLSFRDALHILDSTPDKNLNIRHLVISFGFDEIAFKFDPENGKQTAVKDAVAILLQCIKGFSDFIKRRYDTQEEYERKRLIMRRQRREVRMKTNEAMRRGEPVPELDYVAIAEEEEPYQRPQLWILTLPEHHETAQFFQPYNEALRKIKDSNFLGIDFELLDWAKALEEYPEKAKYPEMAFRVLADLSYDKLHVCRRQTKEERKSNDREGRGW